MIFSQRTTNFVDEVFPVSARQEESLLLQSFVKTVELENVSEDSFLGVTQRFLYDMQSLFFIPLFTAVKAGTFYTSHTPSFNSLSRISLLNMLGFINLDNSVDSKRSLKV